MIPMRKKITPEIVTWQPPMGDAIIGYWLGKPECSAFVRTGTPRDKRGVSAGLKRQVRAEAAALAALRDAYTRPVPSEGPPAFKQVSPFGPMRELESENARLWQEKLERDAVLANVIEAPAKAAQCKAAPAWHADAKGEQARLIAQGTKPRDVAGKLARMAKFSAYGIKAIRHALKK